MAIVVQYQVGGAHEGKEFTLLQVRFFVLREGLAHSRYSVKMCCTNDMLASISCILGHTAAAGESLQAAVCLDRSCKHPHFPLMATLV